jgi:hypothetical protein
MAVALTPADLLDAWERQVGGGWSARTLDLLDAADRDPHPRDWTDRTIGERDRRLMTLRRDLFGDSVVALATCPACGRETELTFSMTALADAAVSGVPADLVVTIDDYTVELRPLVVADLDLARSAADLATAHAALARSAVATATHGGRPVAVDALPMSVLEALDDRLAESDPAADILFDLGCDSCGASWDEQFDIVSFLWAEIDAWALRTLDDVHRLASAYGWTERNVLALGERRRQAYLDLVET